MLKKYFCAIPLILCFSVAHSADIPEEAKLHIYRGLIALQKAGSTENYKDALNEISHATRLAPEWADAWYNLGIVQEATEDYAQAISSFKKYLELSINAHDRDSVTERINDLEYFLAKKIKNPDYSHLIGTWCSKSVHLQCNYRLSVKGNMFSINSDVREYNATIFQRYEGVIDNAGTIAGNYKMGRSNVDLCNGKPDLLSIPLTGKLVNKQTLHLTYTPPINWLQSDCHPPLTVSDFPDGNPDTPSTINIYLTLE
jgi:tetratricopeptide (TPR) repeat protein